MLIGAGIGVTPLVSMLEAIVQCGQQRDIYVLFGFRHAGEHPFKERIAATCRGKSAHAFARELFGAGAGRRAVSRLQPRRADHVRANAAKCCRRTIFTFTCAARAPLMESLVPALWDWGVPESHVHFEAFGPASVRSGEPSAQQVEPCEVRFERSGTHAMWDGSFASLLEFGEAAGVKMPSGCRAGSCGECMMAIRSGAIATVKKPGIPVPDGPLPDVHQRAGGRTWCWTRDPRKVGLTQRREGAEN